MKYHSIGTAWNVYSSFSHLPQKPTWTLYPFWLRYLLQRKKSLSLKLSFKGVDPLCSPLNKITLFIIGYVLLTFRKLENSQLSEHSINLHAFEKIPALKGQSHEIFCTRFFRQSAPSGHIRDGLGTFTFFGFFIELLESPRCLGNRPVVTPQFPTYRGVMTPWFPKYQEVATPRIPNDQGVILLFLWTFKPMLLPLKQHSFTNMSTSTLIFINTFDLYKNKVPSPKILGRLPGFQSTGESFLKSNNFVKIC